MSHFSEHSPSVLKHTGSNLIFTLLPMLIALATVPFMINALGVEVFGAFSLIVSIITYFSFLDFGFSKALSRRILKIHAGNNELRRKVFWSGISMSFLMGFLGFVIIGIGGNFYFESFLSFASIPTIEVKSAILILALGFPFILPIASLTTLLHAFGLFRQANIFQAVSNSFVLLVPIALVFLKTDSLPALILSVVLNKICLLLLLFGLVFRNVVPFRLPSVAFDEVANMFSYGKWLGLIGFITPLLTTVDRFVLASLQGASAVVFYVVPYDLFSRLLIIPSSLSTALFPRLVTSSADKTIKMVGESTKVLSVLLCGALILTVVTVDWAMGFWIGFEFSEVMSKVAVLIVFGVFINSLVVPSYIEFTARKNPKTLFFILLFQVPVFIALLVFLIKVYGPVGAAAAWSSRIILDTVLILYFSKRLKVVAQTCWFDVILASFNTLSYFIFSPEVILIIGGFSLVVLYLINKESLLISLGFFRS